MSVPSPVLEARGWTVAAVERLELAFERGRVVFPVRGQAGELVGHLRYLPDAGNGATKMLADAGTPRDLFPAPEQVGDDEAAGAVWLVEGEPDAVRVWSAGLAAVGVPGAQNWRRDWAARFRGRGWTVLVCFDVDDAGRANGPRAVRDLVEQGVDARLVDLAEYATDDDHGFDLTDLLAARDEPSRARALLDTLAEDAVPAELELGVHDDTFRLESVDWQELEAAGVPELEYLDEPFVPARKRIWGVGPAESGKSLWGAAKSAELTRAGHVVVYVSQENGLEEEARRFLRLRPDYARLRLYVDQGLDLTVDEHRAALLEAAHGSALVVLDTLTACWSGDEDSNRELVAFDRDVLKPLQAAGSSVLVLDHTGNPQPNVRRRGVSAPRGASSKGQKADFLLEFRATGEGSFRVERGKKRGTHGKQPRAYRVVDATDGTLELVESEPLDESRDLVADLVEHMADGEWWTVNALRKPKHRGGVGADPGAIKEALAEGPFEQAAGPTIGKRRGSTYYRLTQASEAFHDAYDASDAAVDSGSVVGVASLLGTTHDDDASVDLDEIERLAELARRAQGEHEAGA